MCLFEISAIATAERAPVAGTEAAPIVFFRLTIPVRITLLLAGASYRSAQMVTIAFYERTDLLIWPGVAKFLGGDPCVERFHSESSERSNGNVTCLNEDIIFLHERTYSLHETNNSMFE